MEERTANIEFDSLSTEVAPVRAAGLAQGSPLSPSLFDFYNSSLVDLTETMKTLDGIQLEPVEVIDTCAREPWHQPAFEHIEVEMNKERAKQNTHAAMLDPLLVIYSDGSAIGANLGAAAVMLDSNGKVSRAKQAGAGSNQNRTVCCAELIAIYHAIHIAKQEQLDKDRAEGPRARAYTIIT
jgi:hypothetical protein